MIACYWNQTPCHQGSCAVAGPTAALLHLSMPMVEEVEREGRPSCPAQQGQCCQASCQGLAPGGLGTAHDMAAAGSRTCMGGRTGWRPGHCCQLHLHL